MLEFAINHPDGPVAIRYPRGGSGIKTAFAVRTAIEPGKGELLRAGNDGAVLALGSAVAPALEAAELLAEKGIQLTIADARFAKPVDEGLILQLASIKKRLITIEENTLFGGFGNAVSLVLEHKQPSCKLLRIGLPDRFIEHGSRQRLLQETGLTSQQLTIVFAEFFQFQREEG
jgi:1-deoxy-D-xylulose-5-phosphate synthase